MKRILTFAMMLLFAAAVYAQSNDRISYQAVVRTSDNVLVYDQDLNVTIAIANSETGSAVYGEQHAVHSNANGLISLMIGNGTDKTGNWSNIEWNHAWVTATIMKGGEQLAQHHVPMSAVPYALYAEKVNCDAVNACVGDGKLTITDGTNNNKKEFTANQTGDQTVTLGKAAFTNNYNDLTNKPTIPAAANDGVLTITDGNTNTKTFTADQATNTTVTLGKAAFTNNYSDLNGTPAAPNNGVLTIKDATNTYSNTFTADQATNTTVTLGKTAFTNSYNDLSDKPTIPSAANDGVLTITDGTTTTTFTANQATNTTVNLGNGKLTITDGNTNTKEFTANQAGNQTVTLGKAAFTNNYSDLTNKPAAPNNGKLTITDGASNTKEFTADQAGDQTVTLGKTAFTNNYNDLTNKPTIPSAPNNSTITIKDAAGNTVGSFTVDQATDGTITLPAQVLPMQKSFRTTYTSGQPKFNLPVPSGKVLDANSYLVQMYINGVYVGDSADGVVTISDGQATYNATPNGGYNLMNGDRVQIVYWVR